MTQILMSLGNDYFYSPVAGQPTPGFDSLSRDSNFSWVAQNRLSRRPAQQFTGEGEEVVSIEGTLYPHIFGGLKTMESLRKAGSAGKPLALVRFMVLNDPKQFMGELLGMFVLRRVRTTENVISSDGLPQKIQFNLELALYGDDPENGSDFLFT